MPAIQPLVYVFVIGDWSIRCFDWRRLLLNHPFWLWFIWLMSLLRHPGVSHQFHRREFTTHLNLSIRRRALFPLLRFQLAGTDGPWTESLVGVCSDFRKKSNLKAGAVESCCDLLVGKETCPAPLGHFSVVPLLQRLLYGSNDTTTPCSSWLL